MHTADAIGDAAQRGARWLLGRLRPEGSLEGAASVGDYYKAPFALTVTGHVAAAQRVLGYVARTFLRRDGGLVTEFPAAEAKAHFVNAHEPAQWYFQYGISAAFLSSLAGATGDRDWLALAQRFLRASRACRDDVYRQPQSGKIGWGAAWTYRLSGDPEDRQLVEAVAEGLHALQSPEGWWSSLNVYDYKKAKNVESNIDVTNEFVGLLGCMELAARLCDE